MSAWASRLFGAAILWMAFLASAIQSASAACCEIDQSRCKASWEQVDRLALVIGIDDYEKARSGLEPLANAVADAKVIASILEDQKFDVVCAIGPTKAELVATLRRFGAHVAQNARALAKDQIALIYFAGHGFATLSADHLLLAPEPCAGEPCAPPTQKDMSIEVADLDRIVRQEAPTGFARVVVVDACRTAFSAGFSALVGADAGHFGRFGNKSYSSDTVFIFSTSQGEMAVDRNEALGASANGLFISRLKEALKFDHVGLQDVYHATRAAFSLLSDASIGQMPDIDSHQAFLQRRWLRAKTREIDRCNAAFDLHVGSFSDCSRTDGRCPQNFCDLARKFCDGPNCMPVEDQACLRPLLAAIRADAETFCRAHPPGPAQIVRVRRAPTPTSIDIAQLQSFARTSTQTAAQARNLEEIANRNLRLSPSRNITRPEDRLRPEILRDLSTTTRAPFDLALSPTQTIRVRELPNATSEVKRIATARDRLVADCFSQPCPDGWLGVRVRSEGETFRGWLRFEEAAALAIPNAADDVVLLDFVDRTSNLSDEAIERLEASINRSRSRGVLAAAISVVQLGDSFNDRSLAEARISRLRRLLVQRGVPVQNIAPAIEVTDGSEPARGLIRISVR
jgi:hypothetical protein